jgi:hypothetical protein
VTADESYELYLDGQRVGGLDGELKWMDQSVLLRTGRPIVLSANEGTDGTAKQ